MKIKHQFFSQGKILILSLILISLTPSIFAQTEPCGFKQAMEMMFQEDPNYLTRYNDFNSNLLENPSQGQMLTDEYEIPIVVHIIHNNGIEYISDSQIYEAVEQANQQLAGNEGGFNTNIKLTFAKIDPLGNCTNGINRVASTLTDVQSLDLLDDITLKNLSRWNTNQYLNIWIVKDMPGDAVGYSYFPANVNELVDGIIVQHDHFGTSGTAAGNIVSTLAHEVGHYLSLLHVWGPDWLPAGTACERRCHDPDDCNEQGDMVCDTNPCNSIELTEVCEPLFGSCEGCPNEYENSAYPKENYMSYTYACQDRFTERQAERMYFALNEYRSELWSPENRICTGLNTIFDNLEIIEDQTWTTSNLINDGDVTITGNLTVESGSTLFIEPGVTVRFCGNGKLVIKPNARLFLSGVLTNSCGSPWKGVEVWGNNELSQYQTGGTRPQGELYCRKGSVIENAQKGVQLWGPEYYNNAGGKIECHATTFSNNRIAVEFAPFENFWPYSFPIGSQGQPRNYHGYFTRCIFETDNNYTNPEPFHSFLNMTGVNGIRINGCSFSMSQDLTTYNNIVNYGYGIFATDSGFNVNPICAVNAFPCGTVYDHSTFQGLGYGIYTANIIGNKPYVVRETDFTDCFVGVYNSAVSEATMLFNNFNLGNVPNPSITSEQLGVVFENYISGFNFEENDFIQTEGNTTLTIGTLSKNVGLFNNVIRRNNYTNLSIGNLSNGQNATFNFNDRGLHYLCNNNFNNSQYDFAVPDDEQGISGIRYTQGIIFEPQPNVYEYVASGNHFSYTSIDFLNETSTRNYYYNPSGINEAPVDYSGLNIFEAQLNDCSQSYCEPPCKRREEILIVKENYYSHHAKEIQAKVDLEIALSNGNDEIANQKKEESEYYKQRMDQEAFMVVLHLMYDTITFHPDSLSLWIKNLDTYGADLQLALKQQSKGNTTMAQQAISRASSREDLSPNQREDLESMDKLMSILDNRSPYNLNENDLSSLEDITDNDNSFAGNISRNILTFYGYHFPIQFHLPAKTQANLYSEPNLDNLQREQTFEIFPNPASLEVNFLWKPKGEEVTVGQLKLIDLSGRLVESISIKAFESTYLQLDKMPRGVLFYQLQTEIGIVKTGKLMVQ